MTYWEYTAALATRASWNDDEDDSDAPDFETMKAGLITFRENNTVN